MGVSDYQVFHVCEQMLGSQLSHVFFWEKCIVLPVSGMSFQAALVIKDSALVETFLCVLVPEMFHGDLIKTIYYFKISGNVCAFGELCMRFFLYRISAYDAVRGTLG